MGKSSKQQRKNTRQYQDEMDDGTIEKEFSDLIVPDLNQFKDTTPPRRIVKSMFRVGMLVDCPNKSKCSNETRGGQRTGTIDMLMGDEALVLDSQGDIHQCFISELTPLK